MDDGRAEDVKNKLSAVQSQGQQRFKREHILSGSNCLVPVSTVQLPLSLTYLNQLLELQKSCSSFAVVS